MSVTIKATYNEPSKKCLWLVKVTGANKTKFCGKRGYLLESKKQDYYRVEHEVEKQKYTIASIDEVKDEDANFRYERIKKLSVSAEDISYQFSFGWGNEIFAETLQELQKRIKEKLDGCKNHIEQAKKSEKAIHTLLDEFNAHLKNSASQSLTGEPNCGLKKTTKVDSK